MLEKPDVQDAAIEACLREKYGLPNVRVSFLPLGADQNTAVYRATVTDGKQYFLKLRRGAFNGSVLELTRFLYEQGIRQIIPPVVTSNGRLCTKLGEFNVILYPFVEGNDGYEVE